jgi:hypothetical protein
MLRTRIYWTRIAGFVSIVVLVLPPFPARAQQTNPDVMYFVLGEKYPKGLNDFQVFGLSREATKGSKPRFHGWVMRDREDPDNSTCDMETVQIKGQNLSFNTKTRQGVRFTFDGRFLRSGDFQPFFKTTVPVVEGIVRKYCNGKKVAEGKTRFTCGSGG